MATAVGQFKDLVESTEKDVPLCETLKKVLNFTAKGWEVARAHALRAVATDNRMRIWLQDDKMQTGLLFRCNLGRVDLDVPVGAFLKFGKPPPPPPPPRGSPSFLPHVWMQVKTDQICPFSAANSGVLPWMCVHASSLAYRSPCC